MMSDDYSRQKLTDVTATPPVPKDDPNDTTAPELRVIRRLNPTAIDAMRKAIARRLNPFSRPTPPPPPAPVGLTARQRVARTKARKQAKASRARNRR